MKFICAVMPSETPWTPCSRIVSGAVFWSISKRKIISKWMLDQDFLIGILTRIYKKIKQLQDQRFMFNHLNLLLQILDASQSCSQCCSELLLLQTPCRTDLKAVLNSCCCKYLAELISRLLWRTESFTIWLILRTCSWPVLEHS